MVPNLKRTSPLKIADGIYFVGEEELTNKLISNPYLIVEDNEAVLIDPGSVLDFQAVYKNVISLVSLSTIKLVVADHQYPDLCSSIPLFYDAGLTAPVALHWRTSIVIKHFGIKNKFYYVNENKWMWKFYSGRTIHFLFAPYCHFAGTIMTYDENTKTVFTGDLFGSLSPPEYIYAGENYKKGMIAFHELYMPSQNILKPVMDSLLNIQIERIAPQHGCIIKDNIEKYIIEIRNIKCGIYKQSLINKQFKQSEMKYTSFFTDILQKLSDIFSAEQVFDMFKGSFLLLDKKNNDVIKFNTNKNLEDLLDIFIQTLIDNNGIRWLSVIEPFFRIKTQEYDFILPSYFSGETNFTLQVNTENSQKNRDLQQLQTKDTGELILYDSITNLYNKSVFLRFVEIFIESIKTKHSAFIYFNIAGINSHIEQYGTRDIEDFLQSFSYILKNIGRSFSSLRIFKLEQYCFSCIVENANRLEVLKIINTIQNTAVTSAFFPKSFYFPASVIYSENLAKNEKSFTAVEIDFILRTMLSGAEKKGINGINDIFMQPEKLHKQREIFILDPDTSYILFLKPHLEAQGYKVHVFTSGTEIRSEIETHIPSLFIAEAMTPQFNGFELRSRLLQMPECQSIPFILISHRKDDSFIQRAAGLKILFFLKKPFSRQEIFGLVNNLLR